MIGLNGGLMGVRKVPATGSASGLWVSNEQSLAKRAGIWPLGPIPDPDFASVSLLLPFDGANNSTTFTDASSNNLTITRTGTPVISTAQSKWGGSSGLFSTAGDRLSVTNNLFAFGTGDFTIECWHYPLTTGDFYGRVMQCGDFGSGGDWQIARGDTIGGGQYGHWFDMQGGASRLASNIAVNFNEFNHVAVTRSGDVFRMFINGTVAATGTFSGRDLTKNTLTVAATESGTAPGLMHVDDLRITKGVARYTANFTAPTAPFPDF
jgi:hypothetical protein